ncbi:MAG: VanZ family protein [Syntrophaceae bacterium]|nr:VanZ family protein [Syntrophaceae bacterium]
MATNPKREVLNRKRALFYFLPAVGYAALIFAVSSMNLDVEELRPVLTFDKLLHLAEYYILGYLLMRAFTTSGIPLLAASPAAAAIVVGSLYGVSDEIHQAFVPGRVASMMDVLFDTAGVTLAVFTYPFVRHRFGPVRTLENRIEAEVSRP